MAVFRVALVAPGGDLRVVIDDVGNTEFIRGVFSV